MSLALKPTHAAVKNYYAAVGEEFGEGVADLGFVVEVKLSYLI
jgi:hypothetical protein